MNLKPFYLLLAVIALLLAGNLIAALVQRPAAAAPSLILPAAQAQNFSNGGAKSFVLDSDSYFITADSSGQNVYLWWFEREPRKDESRVAFIHKATSR